MSKKTLGRRTRNETLLIRVTASPTDWVTNDAVFKVLAGFLDVPPTRLTIAIGARRRVKQILIEGLSAATARARIEAQLAS